MTWTKAELAEIRRMAREATPGPFSITGRENYGGFQGAGRGVVSHAVLDEIGNVPHTQAAFSSLYDAQLYVTARQSLLSLADEVERLQYRLDSRERPKPRWKGRAK